LQRDFPPGSDFYEGNSALQAKAAGAKRFSWSVSFLPQDRRVDSLSDQALDLDRRGGRAGHKQKR
jgi:hypothetical protein